MQAETESVNDYVAFLRSAALHCEFHELDEMLLDQLVCGIKDLKLQRRLLARSELTLQVALDKARAAKLSDQSSTQIQRYQATPAIPRKHLSVHHDNSNLDGSSEEDESIGRLKASKRPKGLPAVRHPPSFRSLSGLRRRPQHG